MAARGEDAVPPDAALIRDFVNTVEWQRDAEQWQTPADLAMWSATHLGIAGAGLSEADLLRARRLREGLRAMLLLNAGHDVLPTELSALNAALEAVPMRMRVAEDGRLGLVAAGRTAAAELFGRVLDAVQSAREDGSWSRIKACSRSSCRWAYWDGSRNGSARWCSMAGCGNFVKMRRRNLASPPPEDVIPLRGDRPRIPTLLDVAGLAGVSIKTASNVVTGTVTVAPATRQRVVAAIDQLGYRPNLAARALRTGRPAVEE